MLDVSLFLISALRIEFTTATLGNTVPNTSSHTRSMLFRFLSVGLDPRRFGAHILVLNNLIERIMFKTIPLADAFGRVQ
jgi:hypothetical protein